MAFGSVFALVRPAFASSDGSARLLVLIADLVCASAKFGTGLLLLRLLGPEQQGLWSLIIGLCGISALLAAMGIDIAVVHSIGRKRRPTGNVLATALTEVVLASIVWSIICIMALPFIAEIVVPRNAVSSVLIAQLCSVLLPVNSVLLSAILAHRRFGIHCKVKIINALVFLTVVASMACCSHVSLVVALAAFYLGYFVSAFISLWELRRLGLLKSFVPKLDTSIALLRYGTRGFWGTLFQFLNYRLNLFLVAYFWRPTDVGLYAAALLIAECLNFGPNAIGTVLLPRAAASSDVSNNQRTPRLARNTAALTLVSAICLALLVPSAVPVLFGSDYLGAVTPIQLLLPGVVALSVWKIVISDLAGRGYPQYKTLTSLAALLVSLPLSLVLIPSLGIVGAAMATSLAYIAAALAALIMFCRETSVPFSRFLVSPTLPLAHSG